MHDIDSNCKIFGYFAGFTAMFDRLMLSNNILNKRTLRYELYMSNILMCYLIIYINITYLNRLI